MVRGLLKGLKLIHRGQRGFTLIELMAVMVILGLIVGLVVPNVTIITKKADSTLIAGQHEKMREAVYKYYHDLNAWPTEWSQYTAAADYDGTVDGTSENENDDTHQLWCSANDDDSGTLVSWAGPYIDRPLLQDDRWGGDWGVIENFKLKGGGTFVCLVYTDVPQLVCRQVDQLMDDGTGTDDSGQDSGVVQYDDNATIDANTLNNDWDSTDPGGAWGADDDNVLVIAIFKQ